MITHEENKEMDLMLMEMSMDDAAQPQEKTTQHEHMQNPSTTKMQPAMPQEHRTESADQAHQKHRPATTPVDQKRDQTIESARRYGKAFGFLKTDIASRIDLAGEGGSDRPLTPYSELKSRVVTTLPKTAPIREVRLTLDGDMERYTWFLNNKPLSETDSLLIKEGDASPWSLFQSY